MTDSQLLQTGYTRVFTLDGGGSPATKPAYRDFARAMAVSWPQGDITPVRVPSRDSYDRFDVETSLQGQQGLPSLPLQFRKKIGLSGILQAVRNGCPQTIQVHAGQCSNPSDFDNGWLDGHVIVLTQAKPTDYSTGELGALDSDARAMVMEDVPFTGLDYYEIGKQAFSRQAASEVTDEVVDIIIADDPTCGSCGTPSNGCQKVFALVAESSESPGISAAVVHTEDGGANWTKSAITSLSIGTDATAIAAVGNYIVVISQGDEAYHYADIDNLLAGTEVWTRVTSGFNTGNGPTDIYAFGDEAWIVGLGGYIYKLSNVGSAVTVQSAGDQTTENLNEIQGLRDYFLLIVGDSNVVLRSTDRGTTWESVTGPSAGVNLNTGAPTAQQVWQIGNANGEIWYTIDGGVNWTETSFPDSGTGTVEAIAMVDSIVGYMSHTLNGVGRLFRTINGGYTWVRQPYGGGIFPANDKLNAIAACEDPGANTVYVGGLDADGADGIVVKGVA